MTFLNALNSKNIDLGEVTALQSELFSFQTLHAFFICRHQYWTEVLLEWISGASCWKELKLIMNFHRLLIPLFTFLPFLRLDQSFLFGLVLNIYTGHSVFLKSTHQDEKIWHHWKICLFFITSAKLLKQQQQWFGVTLTDFLACKIIFRVFI